MNREKLVAALKEDPETVKQLFVQTGQEGEAGLMIRISDSLLAYTKSSTDIALDSLEDRISQSKNAVKTLTQRMEEKEKDLWKKYSAMEAALSRLNGLYNWLSTLFTA